MKNIFFDKFRSRQAVGKTMSMVEHFKKEMELKDLMFKYVTVFLKDGQKIKGYVYEIYVFERLIVLATVSTKRHLIDVDLIMKIDIRL